MLKSLTCVGGGGGGGGVTSVTGTAPVNSSGGTTPAISLASNYGDTQNPYASKTANYILAAPNGSAGAPSFRALVAADIPSLSYVSAVSGTGPISSSGGLTPTISIAQATSTTSGYLSSTDWNTFNNKGSGTVTSVTGTSPVASSGGATPAISLSAGYGDTQNPYTSKTANYFLVAPDGVSGAPTFRALVSADIPNSTIGVSQLSATGTPSSSTYLRGDNTWATVTAGVSSVTGTAPINSSGGANPAISLAADYGDTQNPYASKTANYVLAAPNGSAGAPTFRALVAADIPSLSYVSSVSGTGPISSSGGLTPTISISQASSTTSGYLSSTDWNTFNNKGSGTVTSVTGTSPVASSGGATPAISLSAGYGDTQNPYASKTANYFLVAPDGVSGAPTFRALVSADIPNSTIGVSQLSATGTPSSSTYLRGDNTWATVTGGVASVTATSPVNSSGGSNPDISLSSGYGDTLNPYASKTANYILAAPNGSSGAPSFRALVAADIPSLSYVSSVSATGPISSSGGLTPTISISQASSTTSGYLSSTDWNTFNNKGSGTVTSVTGTAPINSSGGATPAISLASAYGDTQNPYASKTANYVLAAPNGSAGAPTFRALVAADIPTLNQNTTGTAANVTGVVAIANGGTGQTTQQLAINALAGAVTSGQFLRGNGTNVVMSALQAGDIPAASVGITQLSATGTPSSSTYLRGDNTWATVTGGVASVTATSPVASSGGSNPDISLSAGYGDTLNPYASKTANYVLAAPNGSAGTPTFRALVAADIPTLNQNTTGSAGSVANSLSAGTGISGSSFNGSAAVSWTLATAYGDSINPYASKTANYVLAAPNGTAGTPSFRALVAADIPALSYVSSVAGTGPISSSGGLTPTISISQASSTTNGYLSSTDWNTFNNKGSGTVTSVTGTSPVNSSGGATPAISLASGYGDTQNPYASKTANTFLAAPNGSSGAPTFRTLVSADIPNATIGVSQLSATGTPSASTYLRGDNTWATVSGGVASVTATSPVASSGGANPDISLANNYGDTKNPYAAKTANYVLAAPDGSSGVPSFRALASTDIPTTLSTKTLVTPTITGTIIEDVYTITDGAAFEIDPTNGSIQLITLGASRTPKGTNIVAGNAITLMVAATSFTLTWTDTTFGTSGVAWIGGSAPTLSASGYTVIELWKVSTQVYGALVGSV